MGLAKPNRSAVKYVFEESVALLMPGCAKADSLRIVAPSMQTNTFTAKLLQFVGAFGLGTCHNQLARW